MTISGLWHGAGYTFVLWGLMHGVLLCVNHAWRLIRPRIWPDTKSYNRRMAPVGFLLTFLSVVFASVLFRAPSVGAAGMLWKGMVGSYGASLPQAVFDRLGSFGLVLASLGVHPAWTSGAGLLEAAARISVLLVIALALPNSLEILAPFEPALGVKLAKAPPLMRLSSWVPSDAWAFGLACVALAGVLSLGGLSEFLYWQF